MDFIKVVWEVIYTGGQTHGALNKTTSVALITTNLDCHWINDTAYFKASFLELHYRCVVDTCAFRKDQNWWISRVRDVLAQSLCYCLSVFNFRPFKPNVWRCSCQCPLQDSKKPAMPLANLNNTHRSPSFGQQFLQMK